MIATVSPYERVSSVPFSPYGRRTVARSASSETVRNLEERILKSFQVVTSFRQPIWIEFESLVFQWKADNFFESSPYRMADHPAYRRIIGMGWVAVPLILAKLRQEPDFWFEALYSITGEQPVSPSHAGNIKAMTEDWLAWGKRKGYDI